MKANLAMLGCCLQSFTQPRAHLFTIPVIEDDGDPVVEERLSEDEEVEPHVDADLLEDGQHGHRVHRGDQRGERQEGGRAQLALLKGNKLKVCTFQDYPITGLG